MIEQFKSDDKGKWKAVREKIKREYSAFQALTEHSTIEQLVNQNEPTQIPCPFHGPDNKPSARYYPDDGSGHVYCFVCRENWDSIALYSRFNSISYGQATVQLANRFGIDLDIKGEEEEKKQSPIDKIKKKLKAVDKKIYRVRDKCSLIEYTKICMIYDHIFFDVKRSVISSATDEALERLSALINDKYEMSDT